MDFNSYSNLIGKHAFLSASKYHWLNYDEDKLDRVYLASKAAQRGTELHTLAHDLIRLGVKLPENQRALNLYVNDAIGYRMTPEQTLYYSDNAFGTADAIGFKNGKLLLFDLKTGENPGSEYQLWVYAGLFCLEYRIKPIEIEMDLRVYHNDGIMRYEPDPDAIFHVMDKIITFDKRIEELKLEVPS